MKLDGRRKSKNVDDIRKQKPTMALGEYAFPASEGFTGRLQLKTTTSKKRMTADLPKGGGTKMAKKVGIDSMNQDAANRYAAQWKKEQDEKNIEDMSVEELVARDERKRKEAPTNTASYDVTKPKQLKEIWGPKPYKK